MNMILFRSSRISTSCLIEVGFIQDLKDCNDFQKLLEMIIVLYMYLLFFEI